MKSNAKRKQQKAAEMFQRNENFLEKLLSRKAEKSQTHTHKTKDSQSLFDAHSGAIKAIISFPTRKPKHRIGFAFSFPFLWGGCVQRCWRIYALKKRDGNNLLFQITCNECNCKTFFVSFRFVKFDLRKTKKAVKSESFHLHRKLPNSLKNTAAASSHSIVRVKETKEKKLEKEIRKKLTVSSMVISGKKKWRKRPEKELQQLIFNSSPLFFQPFASARLEEKKRLLTSPLRMIFSSIHSFHKKSTEWIHTAEADARRRQNSFQNVIKSLFWSLSVPRRDDGMAFLDRTSLPSPSPKWKFVRIFIESRQISTGQKREGCWEAPRLPYTTIY